MKTTKVSNDELLQVCVLEKYKHFASLYNCCRLFISALRQRAQMKKSFKIADGSFARTLN